MTRKMICIGWEENTCGHCQGTGKTKRQILVAEPSNDPTFYLRQVPTMSVRRFVWKMGRQIAESIFSNDYKWHYCTLRKFHLYQTGMNRSIAKTMFAIASWNAAIQNGWNQEIDKKASKYFK